jgi:hypothetical protein
VIPVYHLILALFRVQFSLSTIECKSATAFIRQKLDQAGVGRDMNTFTYARKKIELPPSNLSAGL